jgi:hypothetical protein
LLIFLFMPCVAESFDLSLGVKAGVTFPWYFGSDYDSWLVYNTFRPNFKIGGSAGGFLTIGVASFLAIQPEVFFSGLGGSSSDGVVTWNDAANGLDLQVLLKLRTKPGKRARFNLFVGPDFFFTANPVKVSLIYYGYLVGSGFWLYPNRVPMYGVTAGLGLEFPLGWFFLTLDGRYNLGLVSRFTEDSPYRSWYQQSIQVMFGIGLVVVGKRESMSRMR